MQTLESTTKMMTKVGQRGGLNKKLRALVKNKIHDNPEQYIHKFKFEYHGIPERERENVETLFLYLKERLETDLRAEDIVFCCVFRR